MLKIGVTGGIGSGKSVVSELLRLYGMPVYDADRESKRLTGRSPVIRRGLLEIAGERVYGGPGGTLDRRYLASFIFGHPENLARVNALIHPVVNRDFLDWCTRQGRPLVAIESAILFESGFDGIVDTVVMVDAPFEIRIARAQARDHAPREVIERRVASQMPDEEKRRRADHVILNDDRQALIPQVGTLVDTLSRQANAHF